MKVEVNVKDRETTEILRKFKTRLIDSLCDLDICGIYITDTGDRNMNYVLSFPEKDKRFFTLSFGPLKTGRIQSNITSVEVGDGVIEYTENTKEVSCFNNHFKLTKHIEDFKDFNFTSNTYFKHEGDDDDSSIVDCTFIGHNKHAVLETKHPYDYKYFKAYLESTKSNLTLIVSEKTINEQNLETVLKLINKLWN